jgi:CheY-like chemotaxis protein
MESAPGGTETILLVEDDDGVRAYTSEILDDLGFAVLEARDGLAALDIVRKSSHIDLLFTDVGLPGLNGRQLADRVREIRPELPVLFATGYARNAIVHQGRLDEGVDLLTKPYTRHQLANKIRDVLDKPQGPLKRPAAALIVEDEPILRELLAYILKAMGFRVVEAASCAEGISAASGADAVDVAIVDIGLGDGQGTDVIRALREVAPKLPVVIASGSPLELQPGSGREGPTVTMPKPYSLQEVIAALRRVGVKTPLN